MDNPSLHAAALQEGEANPPAFLLLRDWFAGQALAEVLAIYRADNGGGLGADHFYQNVPFHAYRLADAMLAERAKSS